ncbi:MAG: DUF1934 domain-containing protein [Oscillospiraceae bacterium]|nr:DUF1934 domain-containing protein [Oscillospiraceae bacterium]
MKQKAVLHLCGKQYYPGQDPEVIELTTEGTMAFVNGGWDICYEESDLTGLAGVTTTFRVEPGKVILRRTGKLRSEMVFQEGICHDSLYQMEFGALMLTVCAKQIEASLGDKGGTVDLTYSIEIEHGEAGLVEYHLQVLVKE